MCIFFRPGNVLSITIALFHFCSLGIASLVSTGRTVTLNGIPYYIPPNAVTKLSSQLDGLSSEVDLVPVTVIKTTSLTFTTELYEKAIAGYTEDDDVFQVGFLEAVYVKYTGRLPSTKRTPFQISVNSSAKASYGSTSVTQITESIAPGPYFLSTSTGSLYQAYRLYSDVQAAFTEGLIAISNGSYTVLPAAIPGIQSPTIGVPSRLYYPKSNALPLNGVRLGVKDIYDIAGVRTGCGNRAYYSLYPEKNSSAVAVQKLIDAGAIIVGKMKTSQFANGETPTADWVDYHAPFNARGDGYQNPSSSSTGPGAGAGSYSWLDLTLGSDTGGSIRGPSQQNGLFGNRPSWDMVSLDGVMSLAPELDTAGFLCRDPELWKTAAEVLYSGSSLKFNFTTFPKNIYTYDFPTSADSEADSIIINFLEKLKAIMGANVSSLDYDALWNASKPASAPSTLDGLLNLTYTMLIGKEQIKLVRDPFYEAYAEKHDGRLPFVNPAPLVRWNFTESYPDSALDEAVTNKTIFKNWWNTKVFSNDSMTCSDSLMLYVGSDGDTSYRNEYIDAPTIPTGFSISRVSNFAEVPDFVVPIGETTYTSTITSHNETLPITINFVAAKGCDGMIFSLVQKMVKEGLVMEVGVGTHLYGDNEILM
ncbi:MAG: hypothetical protein M1834_009430 [Cirrosporium novae-zelandiae]|nr:MAG: hypothetical protein M1834_009430 [Cirrosporium novae-zelandiae]